MTESQKGRMLLSHNFNISSDIAPKLSREEFTQIFTNGLSNHHDITFSGVDNPHWIVEVLFDSSKRTAAEVGQLCAEALRKKRLLQKQSDSTYSILALGGVKVSPAVMTSSPTDRKSVV